MTHRLLGVCAAALLVLPALAAKPPDLPLDQKEVVAPATDDLTLPVLLPDPAQPAASGGLRHSFGCGDPVPAPPAISDVEHKEVLTQVAEDNTGTLIFGMGVNTEAGLTGSVAINERNFDLSRLPASLETLVFGHSACGEGQMLPFPAVYRLSPSVRRTFAASVLFSVHPLLALAPTDDLLDCPGDHPQPVAAEVPQRLAPVTATSEPTCPFLQQKRACAQQAQGMSAPEAERDVLDNLKRLEEAQAALARGEEMARAGRMCEAMDCFLKVEQLCPGRYQDRLTEAMIGLFDAPGGAEETAEPAEAEENPEEPGQAALPGPDADEPVCEPCPKCAKMHAERAGVKEQVDGLMRACHLALSANRPARAAELARQAHALDPRRVAADPVVYRMHLLLEKIPTEAPASCAAVCPYCPRAGACDKPCPPCQAHAARPPRALRSRPLLQPEPPPVDAGVVGALEEAEAGVLEEQEPKPCHETSGCPLAQVGEWFGACPLSLSLLSFPLTEWLGAHPYLPDGSAVQVGLGVNGLLVQLDLRVSGAVYHVHYQRNASVLWVTPDAAHAETGAASEE